MNINEASKASGLSRDTIRFYERHGVVPPPARLANRYRDYSERHVAALRLAAGLRELGAAPRDIAAMVRLAHDGTCGELREAMLSLMEAAIQRLDDRLLALRATRRQLSDLRSAFAGMNPHHTNVPGVTPCECVQLIGRQTTAGQPAGPGET